MTRAKKPENIETYRGVSIQDIRRTSNLVPMRKILDQRWPGGWGDDQVVDLLLERQADKAVQEGTAVRKAVGVRRDREKVLAAKAEMYRTAFPNVTPNDEVLISQLCELELQLDELTDDQAAAVASEDGDTIEAKGKRGQLRLKLVAEHRRIQNELGIARSQRKNEMDSAAVIAGYAAAARKLMVERAVRIECPKCWDTHKINQGYILFHFAVDVPFHWTSTCPNCGHLIEIHGKARQLALAVPKHLTEPTQ